MAALIEDDDVWPLYKRLLSQVLVYGRNTSPRGEATLETRNVTISLTDPTSCLLLGTGRKMSPVVAAAEALQLVGGFSDPKTMVAIAPRFAQYLDEGRFWGAYGNRVGDALGEQIKKLHRDPDTRQANVTIWRNELDDVRGKHDYPCTVSQGFAIRDGKLLMTTHMRSNDAWIGFPYDIVQFTCLQRTVAAFLGIESGAYTHVVDSMHLYDRDAEAAYKYTQGCTRTATSILEGGVVPVVHRDDPVMWSDIQDFARSIFVGGCADDEMVSEARWMNDTMRNWRLKQGETRGDA